MIQTGEGGRMEQKADPKTEAKSASVPEHLTPEWGKKVQRDCARRDPSDLGKHAPSKRCD